MKADSKKFFRARVHTKLTPGEALRTVRELQEMTHRELAKATGIPSANIRAMEKGASQIGRKKAMVLAEALRVHPAVIMFPDFDTRKIS